MKLFGWSFIIHKDGKIELQPLVKNVNVRRRYYVGINQVPYSSQDLR